MSATPYESPYSRTDFDDEARQRALVFLAILLLLSAAGAIVATDTLGWPWVAVLLAAAATVAALGTLLLRQRRWWSTAIALTAAVGITVQGASTLANPQVLSLLALSAAVAAVAAGPGWGALLLTVITGLVWWASAAMATGWALPAITTALCWAVAALLWLYRRTALEVLDWAWGECRAMRDSLDAALDQRLLLKEAQDDLVQANVQLERLAERLALMTRIAEEARDAKESFLASVSHELRTPLNIIIGFSEMITESPEVYGAALPPSLLADIAVIQRNSQHLASLVDDILDLSRADAGRMALSKEWTSLADVVDAAVVAVRPLFASKNLTLDTQVQPNLPPIYCDRTRVRQVVLNLLSNAGRHTMTGGVVVSVAQTVEGLECQVADTGPGIAPEDLERVFEPFLQAGSMTQRRTEGSGLGLSISKRFVEMHGGRMWLESVVGEGTTVSFELPITTPVARVSEGYARWFGLDTQHEARSRPSRAPQPMVKPRYVVVESGQVIQRTLTRYYYDAEIVPATTLGEAIGLLERTPATALVLNSPQMDSALANSPSLLALPQGTPGVVCWAPSEHELAEQLGVHDYLVKPVQRQRLLALLDELGDAVRKVLVVDDDQEAVQLLARMLRAAPRRYDIVRATQARRALALMRTAHPDLVLLDLVMPGMDGYALLRAREKEATLRAIPVIAITGQVASTAFADGRALTVVRPDGVPLADLLTRVLTALDDRNLSAATAALEPRQRPGA
jgi:signal transduction histidine kinase/CheY-like chemotaxis protein